MEKAFIKKRRKERRKKQNVQSWSFCFLLKKLHIYITSSTLNYNMFGVNKASSFCILVCSKPLIHFKIIYCERLSSTRQNNSILQGRYYQGIIKNAPVQSKSTKIFIILTEKYGYFFNNNKITNFPHVFLKILTFFCTHTHAHTQQHTHSNTHTHTDR